jgi:cytochrome c553
VKIIRFACPAAAAACLSVIVYASSAVAQDPPQAGGPGPGGHPAPPPTNLQVLPKDLTGQQVRQIMMGWSAALGVECNTCHAADANNVGANGRPRLNFASDEKDEKKMARIMYTMMEVDKSEYIAKVAALDKMDEPAAPLTCGTCHRGHLDPEKFTPPDHQP